MSDQMPASPTNFQPQPWVYRFAHVLALLADAEDTDLFQILDRGAAGEQETFHLIITMVSLLEPETPHFFISYEAVWEHLTRALAKDLTGIYDSDPLAGDWSDDELEELRDYVMLIQSTIPAETFHRLAVQYRIF
jgi:hypothetical protein